MNKRENTAQEQVPTGIQRKLSRDEINLLPLKSYRGPIHVVRDHDNLLRSIAALKKEALLGFDTETRPAFKKGESYPPALVQLCGRDSVHIFLLGQIGLTEELTGILADEDIIKAGVSVNDDLRELKKLAPFDAAGFVDLGNAARKKGLHHHGLRGLAALLLNFRISKSRQCTNWARQDLDPKALKYAATDAWIGRRLYIAMKKLGCL